MFLWQLLAALDTSRVAKASGPTGPSLLAFFEGLVGSHPLPHAGAPSRMEWRQSTHPLS